MHTWRKINQSNIFGISSVAVMDQDWLKWDWLVTFQSVSKWRMKRRQVVQLVNNSYRKNNTDIDILSVKIPQIYQLWKALIVCMFFSLMKNIYYTTLPWSTGRHQSLCIRWHMALLHEKYEYVLESGGRIQRSDPDCEVFGLMAQIIFPLCHTDRDIFSFYDVKIVAQSSLLKPGGE